MLNIVEILDAAACIFRHSTVQFVVFQMLDNMIDWLRQYPPNEFEMWDSVCTVAIELSSYIDHATKNLTSEPGSRNQISIPEK